VPLDLFPYQEDGARFLASRDRAGLLDKPGVGKSCQVVRACDLRGAARGWIVCPVVAREHWRNEFSKFGLQRRNIVKATSMHDFVAWAHGTFDTLLVSYDMAVRWTPYLHDRCEALDFMVFDEAHYLKNGETTRARALLGDYSDGANGAVQWAKQGWWLTGTPVPNDPIDIYTFLRFQHAMPLMRQPFSKRYFNSRPTTFGSVQKAKPEMSAELRTLIANNSMCRTLEETGVQLPPFFLTNYSVDGDAADVRRLLFEHPGLDEAILHALQNEKGLSGLSAPHVATLRRLIGEAKAVPYAATLLGELQGGLDKMVTFAHHRSTLTTVRDYLLKHNIRCAVLNGETSDKERDAIIHAFQTDPSFRVILANLRSAGTALTLTASAHLDMLEADWAPMVNYQAIRRVYRLTQTRSVRARMIMLANSFDVQVNSIIEAKTRAVAELDTAGTAESFNLEDMLS
jgi:SWI/SNF-related matrix-associated actin-dependent regulator 1 of chromatin subfamily A